MKRKIAILAALLLAFPAMVRAQRDTIEVSVLYTTYIRFPIELLTAERSDEQNIMGEIVPESKNIIRLRAAQPFRRTSNITVIDSKGYLHTYYIRYCDHPAKTYYDKSVPESDTPTAVGTAAGVSAAAGVSQPSAAPSDNGGNRETSSQKAASKTKKPARTASSRNDDTQPAQVGTKVNDLRKSNAPTLNNIIDLPQSVFHLATRKGRMLLVCENIFTYSDMLYIVMRIDNHSGVSYESDGASFTLATLGRRKKIPLSMRTIVPKNRYGTLTVAPGESGRIAYSLDKLTLSDDQSLQISIPERNGMREFMIVLSAKDINLAKTPPALIGQ